MKTTLQTTNEIKNQILDKAFTRFGQYGFGKTTMSEIARDCDMSAGNLYRYFANKKEIGAGCAERCMVKKENLQLEILRRPQFSASQKLEAYVVEGLQFLHKEMANQPRMYELVAYISNERWDLVCRHQEAAISLLSQILEEGARTGEFDVPNVSETAKLIYAAMTRFLTPHYMTGLPLDELVSEATGVVGLVIRGLAKH